jgi:hypothetical protein
MTEKKAETATPHLQEAPEQDPLNSAFLDGRCYCEQGGELWTRMREMGMQPDAQAYDSLVAVLGRTKAFHPTEQKAREARAAGFDSSGWALTALALCAVSPEQVRVPVNLTPASHQP